MLDIVFVNYNSTNLLKSAIRSVYDALDDDNAVIFVQDNASKDAVDEILVEFPEVKLTKNSRNIGFARAVNQALEAGTGEFVILVNPDARVTRGFFKEAIGFMLENPEVAIMGPKVLDADGSLQNSARSFPTLLTAFFGRTSFLSRYFPQNPFTCRNLLSLNSDGSSPMSVDWVSGACMVVRRTAIDAVGGFDERFFLYWEDADWCRKMRDAGWRVVYFPQVEVYHSAGGSSETHVVFSVFQFHKSVYRLFDKYLPAWFALLKPLVLAGLSLRLLMVLALHAARRSLKAFHGRQTGFSPANLAPCPDQRPKIKILRIISRLNIGGPAIHIHRLMKGLDSRRFTSQLVIGSISRQEGSMAYLLQDLKPPPVVVRQLQREVSPWKDLAAVYKLLKLMIDEAPDVVHTHTAKVGASARLAALIYNRLFLGHAKTVHTFHGTVFEGYFSPFKSRLFIWIERFLARYTDAIVAISDTQKADLVSKYAIASRDKIHIITLGFNLRPFLDSRQRAGRFRSQLGIGSEHLLVGIVGRLVPIKHHRMFLDAASLYVRRDPDRKVHFAVVGDGELRNKLEQIAGGPYLSGRVTFCGWIHDIAPVYADLDVLALTSQNEGTPVSIIEAMAAGVPVIATDAGGVRDLMGPVATKKNGFRVCQNGLLCLKDDARGFSAGLEFLAGEDPSQRAQRVQRARSFVTRQFDQARLIVDIEALYEQLLKCQGRIRL